MADDQIVCPMHGLHFGHDGACSKIPSIANSEGRIPPKLRLETYASVERYGIVWACLKNKPIWELPVWEGISNPDFRKVYVPNGTWHAAASRHVENFNDVAHFPWVHTQSFGGSTTDPIPPYEVGRPATACASNCRTTKASTASTTASRATSATSSTPTS
jgi:vanillate O-demethylase monooxygenase subunit